MPDGWTAPSGPSAPGDRTPREAPDLRRKSLVLTLVTSAVLAAGLVPAMRPAPRTLESGATTTRVEERFGIESLSLDEPLSEAVRSYGRPDRTEEDIFGPVHSWEVAPGARLHAGVWDGDERIYGLVAEAPADGSATLSTYGGVELGRSTLRDVVAAWGPGYVVTNSTGTDYVVAYDACLREAPVVVKFDQAPEVRGHAAAGAPALDEPVTRALIAYADADPATSGCDPVV